MRKTLGAVVVVVLCVPAMVAGAATSEENVRDDFGSVTYSGNDGSLDWSGSWVESGDDGDPAKGKIQIVDGSCSNNKCLRMAVSGLAGALVPMEVKRRADLSGFSNATLSFDLVLDPVGITARTFFIDVKGNGSGWHVVDSYDLLDQSGSFSKSYAVSSYAGSDFELRFRVSGLLGGDNVYVDRVDVRGAVPVTTTTSTTSTTSTTPTTSTTTTQPSGSSPAGTPSRPPATSTTTVAPTTSSTEPSETVTTRPDPPVDDSTPTPVEGRETPPEDGAGGQGQSSSLPPGSGLRVSAVGVMADYRAGSMGEMDTAEIEVLGAELEADYSLAVETFERAKIWMAILSLFVAAAAVSGMDWKRSKGTEGLR